MSRDKRGNRTQEVVGSIPISHQSSRIPEHFSSQHCVAWRGFSCQPSYGLFCRRLRAACFNAVLIPPRAIARISESGRVGRIRSANASGVFLLCMSATRTSTLAIH